MKCSKCEITVQGAGYLLERSGQWLCPECYNKLVEEASAWGRSLIKERKAKARARKKIQQQEGKIA